MYLPNNNLASIHRKSVFVGASTLCQRTWEMSHPPVHCAIDKPILVLAMYTKVVHELVPGSFACSPVALENTDLDNHQQIRKSLWKSRNPAEKFQHTVGTRKSEAEQVEEGQRKSLSLSMSRLPQSGTASAKRALLSL